MRGLPGLEHEPHFRMADVFRILTFKRCTGLGRERRKALYHVAMLLLSRGARPDDGELTVRLTVHLKRENCRQFFVEVFEEISKRQERRIRTRQRIDVVEVIVLA